LEPGNLPGSILNPKTQKLARCVLIERVGLVAFQPRKRVLKLDFQVRAIVAESGSNRFTARIDSETGQTIQSQELTFSEIIEFLQANVCQALSPQEFDTGSFPATFYFQELSLMNCVIIARVKVINHAEIQQC